jgi:diadenylate cyclase
LNQCLSFSVGSVAFYWTNYNLLIALSLTIIWDNLTGFTFWDFLDVAIISLLLLQLYRLLKGTAALYIFFALCFFFVFGWLANLLEMKMLSAVLNQFISVGVIVSVIVFQPEIRKLLILLGNQTAKGDFFLWKKYFSSHKVNEHLEIEKSIQEIGKAVQKMSEKKTGALIVFGSKELLFKQYESGIPLHAQISSQLIVSIFQKSSPLHDGALLIGEGLLLAAACVLPLAEDTSLPLKYGLRHRAAVGIGELGDVKSIIVSEETGKISTVNGSTIDFGISLQQLDLFLKSIFLQNENKKLNQ